MCVQNKMCIGKSYENPWKVVRAACSFGRCVSVFLWSVHALLVARDELDSGDSRILRFLKTPVHAPSSWSIPGKTYKLIWQMCILLVNWSKKKQDTYLALCLVFCMVTQDIAQGQQWWSMMNITIHARLECIDMHTEWICISEIIIVATKSITVRASLTNDKSAYYYY